MAKEKRGKKKTTVPKKAPVSQELERRETTPLDDVTEQEVNPAKKETFNLYDVGVACACSPCPEDILKPLIEEGYDIGGGTCIEAVFSVLTQKALDGSEPHTKLLLEHLGGRSNGTNINISNTMNVNNYHAAATRITNDLRKIAFPDSSGEDGKCPKGA